MSDHTHSESARIADEQSRRIAELEVRCQALVGQNMQLVFIIAKIVKQYGDGEGLTVSKEIEKVLPKDTVFNLTLDQDDDENLLIGIECESHPEMSLQTETSVVM